MISKNIDFKNIGREMLSCLMFFIGISKNNSIRKTLSCMCCVFVLFVSCERREGWGVLLWANEDAGIPSGTVLPVYIKSNIEKKWVVGVPKEFKARSQNAGKIEIPLAQLEFFSSKNAAEKRAANFGEYTLIYAEAMQDGLPVRDEPDNSAQRVYRLRIGEIIKILEPSKGIPAISAAGDPLPGDWYKVLTENGTKGYCFSYRLSLFDHTTGSLSYDSAEGSTFEDPLLGSIQSKTWSADIYNDMLNKRKFDVDILSKHWGFSTGEDTGIANIYTADIDRSFRYTSIKQISERDWRFEGTTLSMSLISDNLLSVKFINTDGSDKTLYFVSLPTPVDDLITQEKNRREEQLDKIYDSGPVWVSPTFGTLTFTKEGDFLWEDFELLVPDYIPISAMGRGTAEIRYNISDTLSAFYNGVLTLRFKTIGSTDRNVNFLYTLGVDEGGDIRIEYISPNNIQDGIAVMQDSSPMVIYFYRQAD
jgi:hypothetical protein